MTSDQLFLKFKQNPPLLSAENFIFTPQTQKARTFLEKFLAQEQNGDNFVPSAILIGEKSSGKTHLVNIFAKKHAAEAQIVDPKSLDAKNLVAFFRPGNFYIFEDIDGLNDDNLLFHIINSAFENKAFLLMTAQNIDNFKLNDLNSRLKNIISVKIEGPDQDLLKMLIAGDLSRRQLKFDSDKINFLAKNTARTYDAAKKIVDKIEEFCFENKKQPTQQDLKVLIESL